MPHTVIAKVRTRGRIVGPVTAGAVTRRTIWSIEPSGEGGHQMISNFSAKNRSLVVPLSGLPRRATLVNSHGRFGHLVSRDYRARGFVALPISISAENSASGSNNVGIYFYDVQ